MHGKSPHLEKIQGNNNSQHYGKGEQPMTKKKTTLEAGLKGSALLVVSEEHTARSWGSGDRDVLATPILVALFEAAAEDAVAKSLTYEEQTVGVQLELTHLAPTPVGMGVKAQAELTSVSGRNLVFSLSAHDEMEEIARGTHTRTLATRASFDRLLLKKL